jgi:hypothetical protein
MLQLAFLFGLFLVLIGLGLILFFISLIDLNYDYLINAEYICLVPATSIINISQLEKKFNNALIKKINILKENNGKSGVYITTKNK